VLREINDQLQKLRWLGLKRRVLWFFGGELQAL
jgi:hypothetical protein